MWLGSPSLSMRRPRVLCCVVGGAGGGGDECWLCSWVSRVVLGVSVCCRFESFWVSSASVKLQHPFHVPSISFVDGVGVVGVVSVVVDAASRPLFPLCSPLVRCVSLRESTVRRVVLCVA